MAIAAVPKYLGSDFSQASPGLRFGMYLQLWGEDRQAGRLLWTTSDTVYRTTGPQRVERAFDESNKRSALDRATDLTPQHRNAMHALADRQSDLALRGLCTDSMAAFDAKSIAPFTTGLGNEHPLENGFAFLSPHGLPYLPGSGVKGAIRAAAGELASGNWGSTGGWTVDAINSLFGTAADRSSDGKKGALSFWDAFPRLPGDRLHVEIMTPHQSHYLQGRQSPHDSGSPNPISFLTVPPGAHFSFYVGCDLPFLARIAPGLAAENEWKRLLEAAFEHAFAWLGFGAKTSVGYGAMERDEAAGQARERARLEAALAERRRQMTAQRVLVESFIDRMQTRQAELRGAQEQPNAASHQAAQKLSRQALEDEGWSPEDRRAAAEAIHEWLPKVVRLPDQKEAFKKLKLRTLLGDG
ncbi:MAG: type III-B CRISPR module RAMP protein Cmr6 [Burkholderiales bacterium]|nr:type III-B CRISPR module RAMP protein Cmr6 [Burkholderiales bacterium]